MGQRTDLGLNWSDIVKKYYFDKSPSISGELAWDALGIVEDLWPEYIEKVLSDYKESKTPEIIARIIDMGFILKACEKLGLEDLLRKIRIGDLAALSEAKFATIFVKFNYGLVYEPTNRIGKKPDFCIFIEDKEVYAEVISPNYSEEMKLAFDEMLEIANKEMEQNYGKCLDIILSDCKSDASTNEKSPRLGVAKFKKEGNIITRVNVHLQFSDNRARKLMEKESKHFTEDDINLLVMDVSSIPDGIKGWKPLIERSLQPKMNRRFGAVVLFESKLINGIELRNWDVLKNPYAYYPVPETLLNDIRHLNDSMQLADLIK